MPEWGAVVEGRIPACEMSANILDTEWNYKCIDFTTIRVFFLQVSVHIVFNRKKIFNLESYLW